jgi:hypothetical protein
MPETKVKIIERKTGSFLDLMAFVGGIMRFITVVIGGLVTWASTMNFT